MYPKIYIFGCVMLVVFIWALFGPVFCKPGVRCEGPLGQNGSCINVNKCQAYFEELENVSSEVRRLQQRPNCGGDGSGKGCCPHEDGDDPDAVYREPPPSVAGHENLRLLPDAGGCGYLNTSEPSAHGANTAGLLEFPWMALISFDDRNSRKFLCAGTIINDRYILTAAHCVTNVGDRVLAGVRVGEYDQSKKRDCETAFQTTYCNPPIQDIGIEKVIPHPGFVGFEAAGSYRLQNDIGLLRLQRSIDLTQANAKPVCLPINRELREMSQDWTPVLPGWGLMIEGEDGDHPELRKINVSVVSNRKCGVLYNKSIADGVGFRQMCAGGEKGVGSCGGNGGAPLLLPANYVQIGIVSGGTARCGRKNAPSVYTRVAYYMDWILDTLEP